MFSLAALRRWFNETWTSTFELYQHDEADAGAMRAQLMERVQRLMPLLAVVNVFNTLLVLTVLRNQNPLHLTLWAVGMTVVSYLMARGWLRWSRRRKPTLSRRTLYRAAWGAATLALMWGAVGMLWYDKVDAGGRVMMAALFSGLMGGGMYVLMPLPLSALAYLLVMMVTGAYALWSAGDNTAPVSAALMFTYGLVLMAGTLSGARAAIALLRSEREAARQRQFVSVLLDDFERQASEALWQIDAQGRLTHVSPRLADLLGQSSRDLPHAPLLARLGERSPEAAQALQEILAKGLPFQGLKIELQGDGADRWWTIAGKPLFDLTGKAEGWRGVIADTTHEVLAQRRLHQLAHHDGLTSLANRLTLGDQLEDQLHSGRGGALLAIDLDHFKSVNDTLGHSMGDALLKEVAQRLRQCVRPTDVVARLGGDEFAMLLTSPCSAERVNELAWRVVQQIQVPFAIGNRVVAVGCSVGAALLPEHGHTADELTVHADLALYEAKARGRGCAVLYEASMGRINRRRHEIEEGLPIAILNSELQLYWQAQVDIRTGSLVGAEALLRWQHPDIGWVSPAEFIPLAERSGLINNLGRWVMDEACRVAAQRLPGISISVNVSPAQLRDEGFTRDVLDALARHGLPAARLELEITESVYLEGAEGPLRQLEALREAGVRIALDDFGTGYSSLSYLRRFPFDTLKIDRTFVSELMHRPDAQSIVRTIVMLAEALGMRTIAEGVETDAQLLALAHCGCHEAQGYLLSHPCPLSDFEALMHNWVAPDSVERISQPMPLEALFEPDARAAASRH